MKAITLHQPWASLIAEGHKTIETRDWPPPLSLVGQRIAIHAGKRKPRRAEWNTDIKAIIDVIPVFEARLESVSVRRDNSGTIILDPSIKLEVEDPRLPLGAVVATAVLHAVWQVVTLEGTSDGGTMAHCKGVSLWKPHSVKVDPFGDYSVGRYLWHLRDIRRLPEPVPATGRQGIWNWEPPE